MGIREVRGILLLGDRPVWANSLQERCFEMERGQLVISFHLRVVIMVLKRPAQLRLRTLSSRPCLCALPSAGVRLSMPGFHARLGARLRSEAQGADTVLWLALAPAATAQPSGCFFQGDFLSKPQPKGLWRWTLLSPGSQVGRGCPPSRCCAGLPWGDAAFACYLGKGLTSGSALPAFCIHLPERSGSREGAVSPGVVTPDLSVLGMAGPAGHLGDWKLLCGSPGPGNESAFLLLGGGYLSSVCYLRGRDPNRQARERGQAEEGGWRLSPTSEVAMLV